MAEAMNISNTNITPPQEDSKKKKRLVVLISLLLLLLLLGTCAATYFLQGTQEAPQTQGVVVMPNIDANARDITTRGELELAMQEAADAHYFTLQINPQATVSASTGAGTFEIRNPVENIYPISVELYHTDGTLLYQTGALMPNTYLDSITLSQKIDPGSYTSKARVLIYNPQTYEKEGETEAVINLNVIA